MWKQIRTCKDYFLLFNEEYEIFLTDFVSIWYEYFSKSSFIDRLKENNRKFNIGNNSLFFDYGILLVKYPEFVNKVVINPTEEHFCITFVGSQKLNKSIPFKIQLKLRNGTTKLFFQKVTSQLLKTIQILKSSQKELCSLLKKKDVEIDDYKYEGAKVTIKANETEKFNEEEHTLKYCTEVLPNNIVDIILSTAEENKSIKQETNECDIKVEPCASASVTSIKIEATTPVEIRNEFSFPMNNDVKKESNEQRNQYEAITPSLKRELPLPDANKANTALKQEVENEINAIPNRNREIKKEVVTTSPRKKTRKFCF